VRRTGAPHIGDDVDPQCDPNRHVAGSQGYLAQRQKRRKALLAAADYELSEVCRIGVQQMHEAQRC
jgi:hypothetical protein